MWRAAQRLESQQPRQAIILHFGDHDPSGMQMTEDIAKRLDMFESSVEVHRIALTMEQVNQFNAPPNPAKMTDPRAEEYIAQYGESSWELDALEPVELARLVREHVLKYRDEERWAKSLARETTNAARLQRIPDNWESIEDHLDFGDSRREMRENLRSFIATIAPGQRRSAFAKRVLDYLKEYPE
jgi:hypothetical protein